MAVTYSMTSYSEMLRDRVRVEAYVEALRRLVRPDSVVLDLGTGTGFLACVAAKYGARQVYAMEPSPYIQIARESARRNGLSDRICFFNDVSTRLELPEQVDIIVGDLRGVLPVTEDNLTSFQDAVTRFLKPGGQVIPQRDTLLAGLVQSPELYAAHFVPWLEGLEGLELSSALRCSTNSWGQVGFKNVRLLSDGSAELGAVSYEKPNLSFSGNARLVSVRRGLAHGVLVWFRSQLAEGVSYVSGPTRESGSYVYSQAFFPFSEPLILKKNEVVDFLLEARWTGRNHVWRWQTRLSGRVRFDQTSVFSEPLPFDTPPLPPKQVAHLSRSGQIPLLLLQAASQCRTVEEMARMLVDSPDTDVGSYPDAYKWIGRYREFFFLDSGSEVQTQESRRRKSLAS